MYTISQFANEDLDGVDVKLILLEKIPIYNL